MAVAASERVRAGLFGSWGWGRMPSEFEMVGDDDGDSREGSTPPVLQKKPGTLQKQRAWASSERQTAESLRFTADSRVSSLVAGCSGIIASIASAFISGSLFGSLSGSPNAAEQFEKLRDPDLET